MGTRVRAALHTMKTPPPNHTNHDRVKQKEMLQGKRLMDDMKNTETMRSRRERKMALQQDVDKLKKKLRHEENVHRALERAFTRPLGSLPRLPPYLPPYTLELLAEVAVLEEEVVRLEEQIVNFRHGLYQEAIYISSSKKTSENASDLYPCLDVKKSPGNNNSIPPQPCLDPNQNAHGQTSTKKVILSSPSPEERRGKEKRSPQKKLTKIRTSASTEKHLSTPLECKETSKEGRENTMDCSQYESAETAIDVHSSPNNISEGILKCLLDIFSRMQSPGTTGTEADINPSISGFHGSLEDPYRVHTEFGERDVGPYKHLLSIDESSINPNLISCSSYLTRKLKNLLKKLELVDLRSLNHQQKLAFWINIYNSCIMNAILDQGIPSSPQIVVALMQKAMINVGGHLLSAMTIEHFILRLPYSSKCALSKNAKNDEMKARSNLGLDWPEPLVTFALSCGSWSSPAVRVYSASQVENELETAKRDYLQAAVGISPANKLSIPKLLDWYILDFAKDVESLMDWICLQLPSGLRNDAVKCIERARRGASASQTIQVQPYEFSFRYLLPR